MQTCATLYRYCIIYFKSNQKFENVNKHAIPVQSIDTKVSSTGAQVTIPHLHGLFLHLISAIHWNKVSSLTGFISCIPLTIRQCKEVHSQLHADPFNYLTGLHFKQVFSNIIFTWEGDQLSDLYRYTEPYSAK